MDPGPSYEREAESARESPPAHATGGVKPGPDAVELRGLARSYRSRFGLRTQTALGGIDLRVGRGEFLGLLGANGSGKSTLLALIAGLERPSSGTVQVFGAPPDHAPARRRTGYAGDRCAYPTELSPRSLLRAIAALRGLPRSAARSKCEEELDRFGLSAIAGHRLGRLSAGERRRFELAQAFLHDPDLLLLDEPSAGLDAPGERVLSERLDAARERGATVLIASHDGADVFGRCERFAILNQARLARVETSEQLLSEIGEVEWTLTRAELDRVRSDGESQRIGRLRPSSRSLSELYAGLAQQPGTDRDLLR